jgi:hypothetical protein
MVPQQPQTVSSTSAPPNTVSAAGNPNTATSILRDFSAAAVLATLAGKELRSQISLADFKTYRDQLLAECGRPTDPIEIMLLEEFVWAHHRLGQLHAEAANAKSADLIEAFNGAATKLMAELRRSALALREYRSPITPQRVTVVQQQNLAAGDQQVALIDGSQPLPAGEKNKTSSKLGSNLAALNHVDLPAFDLPADCRQTESVETKRLNGCRPPALAGGRANQPAVAELHGPAVNHRQSEGRQ